MLADDGAALAHQSDGSFVFGNGIIPGVGVLNVHVSFGNDGLDAQEESGITGNHFRIGESADITDIGIGNSASIQQLLQLHTGDNAGDIAGLIRIGEDVLEVVKTGVGSGIAGAGYKDLVRILTGDLLHIGLMAVVSGEDDIAARFRQIDGVVSTGLVFGSVVLENDLRVYIDTQFFAGLNEAIDMSDIITGVCVVTTNQTDFHLGKINGVSGLRGRGSLTLCRSLAFGTAASGQRQDHDKSEKQCKKLLHLKCPPKK